MSDQGTLPKLRLAIAALGSLMIAVALLADRLGLDSSETFGTGETLFLAVGIILILIAASWKRAPTVYKATAILLLNTLVLLVAIELAAIVFSTATGPNSQLPTYYAAQAWSERYWAENGAAGAKRYEPYTIWRRKPFQGEAITIDSEGLRATGTDCDEAREVFMFGGSTMWGWGAPDWLTIPAHVQAGLTNKGASAPCVTNFADDSYITTQSVVALIRALQSGARPDLVIVYDGINDTMIALESGEAGMHGYADDVSLSPEKPLIRALSRLQTAQLVQSLHQGRTNELSASELQSLADSVARVYLGNYEIVAALAERYGFDYHFFWQPALAVEHKKLTKREQSIRDGMSPRMIELFQAVSPRIAEAACSPRTIGSTTSAISFAPREVSST